MQNVQHFSERAPESGIAHESAVAQESALAQESGAVAEEEEVATEEMEDVAAGGGDGGQLYAPIEFTREPMECLCPRCGKIVETTTRLAPGVKTVFCSILLLCG